MNEVLDQAWRQVLPLLEGAGSTYALQFRRAAIAPVRDAWLCPVTRRVLPRLVFDRSPYGLRSRAPDAQTPPEPLRFPQLPLAFPSGPRERAELAAFVAASEEVADLRARGVWGDLHDRAATFSPYMRTEEHSAQQPAERLRAFEAEFKRGEINILACSTTMEMGVDIGSVQAVLNTNVPPSVANYRQRVGRAGRRGQSFSSSLTLARDTPLDREAFRDPASYLQRLPPTPQVRLDSAPIVQRHVDALLLARWFRAAEGQLVAARTGDFFGLPPRLGDPIEAEPPVTGFIGWLADPSTAAVTASPLARLTFGTVLAGRGDLLDRAREGFATAAAEVAILWAALCGEAAVAAAEARSGLERQATRLKGETLLKELANRSLLPSHGFPNAVVPFLTDCRETVAAAAQPKVEAGETDRGQRYGAPSRNADMAIREYAPGAQVVIDGLVWTSAGVTLNWRRPATDLEAQETQSLKWFWTCRDCRETGCAALKPTRCDDCGSEHLEDQRYLEPAGFRVDWEAKPHAQTDTPLYIEPEPPRVSVSGTPWEPLLDPALGQARATSEGRVFHLSRGAGRQGYHVCLDCGRAAEAGTDLAEHSALTPRRGGGSRCAGNDKTYAVTERLALGHEIQTDVAELQPAGLDNPGTAWALASALREGLAKRLAIEPRELGLAVEFRPSALGRAGYTLQLFDQAAGGAGYAPRMLDDLSATLQAARQRLDCPSKCVKGCSACVLAPDLYGRQEIMDREAALVFVDRLREGLDQPQAEEVAAPGARLSPPAADALARRLARGRTATLYACEGLDLSALGEPPFVTLFNAAKRAGARLTLALAPDVFEAMNDAERRGLRNASHRYGFEITIGRPVAGANGAALLAGLTHEDGATGFFSRDRSAQTFGPSWGLGVDHPVVSVAIELPTVQPVPEEALERQDNPGDRVRILNGDPARPNLLFGTSLVTRVLRPELEAAGLWRPGRLCAMAYSDRYLKAPLPLLLLARTLVALRDALAPKGTKLPVTITTEALRTDAYASAPSRLSHNWLSEDDRVDCSRSLLLGCGFDVAVQVGAAPHGRRLQLDYDDGQAALILFDQGFGYWRATGDDRHAFRTNPERQARTILESKVLVAGFGDSYIAITAP